MVAALLVRAYTGGLERPICLRLVPLLTGLALQKWKARPNIERESKIDHFPFGDPLLTNNDGQTITNEESFTFQKIQKIFDVEENRKTLSNAEKRGDIPEAVRTSGNHRKWFISQLPMIGQHYGFMQAPDSPKVAVIYSKKGGVFKTSIALNMARMAALHNIKVLVVGLDDQTDITSALGHDFGLDDDMSVEEADKILDEELSLADLIDDDDDDDLTVRDLICKTDLPTLDYIPEVPELDFLEQEIQKTNLRDLWLIKNVIAPLKNEYQLFVLDLGPAWNMLTVNALMASNILISPIECKINNYRNLKFFRKKIEKFVKNTSSSFSHVFIPVKANDKKKLNRGIKKKYQQSGDCVSTCIPVSGQVEDAMAMKKSVVEFAPSSTVSTVMKQTIKEIWHEVLESPDNPFIEIPHYQRKSSENSATI